MGELLNPGILSTWKPDNSRPADQGPLQFCFNKAFSINEMYYSQLDGAPMRVDPHYDARQSLFSLACLVDAGATTRAIISLDDQTESMVVDIIEFKGEKIRTLPDSGDPMVLVRVALHRTSHPGHPDRNTIKIVEAVGHTMPSIGCSMIIY